MMNQLRDSRRECFVCIIFCINSFSMHFQNTYAFCFLKSRYNGYCLDNYRNGNIGTYQCGSALWQKWEIIPASGITSKIKNMDTNKCLAPNGKELNCNDSRVLWNL